MCTTRSLAGRCLDRQTYRECLTGNGVEKERRLSVIMVNAILLNVVVPKVMLPILSGAKTFGIMAFSIKTNKMPPST